MTEEPIIENIEVPAAQGVDDIAVSGNQLVAAPKSEKQPRKPLKEEIREVREAIKARESVDVPAPEDGAPPPPKTGRERDEARKFKDAQKAADGAPKPVKDTEPKAPVVAAPEGLPPEVKAEWAKLNPKIQAALVKREADIHKGMTTMDEERSFAKEMQKTILPYMPLINSSQSTPAKAVTELFNYAHILQTGSAQSKGQLLWQLAQRWGADMRATPQAQAQPQFQIGTLQQELQQTKQQLAQLPTLIKQQQEEANLRSVIESFAADPKNAHYARVKPVMAALLSGGQAKDMQDAYDKACYADPDIRSTLMADKQKADEAKRVADLKAKAATARNASVSVKGSSGLNGRDPAPPRRSLREELQANFRAAIH